jgi:hypothetical protein
LQVRFGMLFVMLAMLFIGQYIIKNIIIIALALLLFVVTQKNKIAEHN